jgi:hypothetical protein
VTKNFSHIKENKGKSIATIVYQCYHVQSTTRKGSGRNLEKVKKFILDMVAQGENNICPIIPKGTAGPVFKVAPKKVPSLLNLMTTTGMTGSDKRKDSSRE